MTKTQSAPHRSGDFRIPLSSVIYKEGPWWIAHCLQLDLVAEGKNRQEALRTLLDLVQVQIAAAMEAGDIESILRPAPAEIWRMFWMSRETAAPKRLVPPIERFEVRELAFS